MEFEIKHWGFAKVNELYDYEAKNLRKKLGGWDLKAHGRSFVVEKCKNHKGEKILDVGAGPSFLPQYLHDLYNVDVTVIDDFGLGDSSDKTHYELIKN